ncbi:MAG: hypothetical protein Q3983_02720 [Capnocytophaga sp.]|nr:hypothetical protein [Capnocytophaga sp.]
MKKKFITLNCLLVFNFYSVLAQNNTQSTPQEHKNVIIEVDNSIRGQFDEILEKSNNYEQYKVVPKAKLNVLKNSVLDTLLKNKNVVLEKSKIIEDHENKIKELESKISTLETDLTNTENKKDSIDLFGMLLSKSLYSSIVWGIIVALGALLSIFIFKFGKSNAITKNARKLLEETQLEYEEYRAKSIEREQKVRRQLQDEINKNKNN